MDWARTLTYVTGPVDQELLARNESCAGSTIRTTRGDSMTLAPRKQHAHDRVDVQEPLILKWATPWCPRYGVLFGRGIVNEPLTVNEPNFKLGTHLIGNRLNGRADNKRGSSQNRFPNGRKVRAAMRRRVVSDQQIVCGFNHRIIPFPLRPSATITLHPFRRLA
jgi:hypothetical protein